MTQEPGRKRLITSSWKINTYTHTYMKRILKITEEQKQSIINLINGQKKIEK